MIFYIIKSETSDSFVNHFNGHFAYLKTLDFYFKQHNLCLASSEPVWPSGKVLFRLVSGRLQFDSPLRFSFRFKSCGFSMDTVLWFRSSQINETLKWLSSLPIFRQKSFWSVALGIAPDHPPPPFPPPHPYSRDLGPRQYVSGDNWA